MPVYSASRRTLPLIGYGFFDSFSRCAFKVWSALVLFAGGIDYLNDFMFLTVLAAVWVLPPLLLAIPAGFIADRLPKRYVIIALKLLEIPLLCTGIYILHRSGEPGSGYRVLAIWLFYSVFDVFRTPAYNALLPETFSEPELSLACGKSASASMSGALAGAVIMPGAFYLGICEYVMFAALAGALFSAVKIVTVISVIQRKRELIYPYSRTLFLAFAALCRKTGLWASALGEVCFIGLGITAFPLLILFCKYILGITDFINILLLLPAPGLGFMIGCFCAGIFSRNKIELGLIPLGALGMMAALPLAVFFPGIQWRVLMNFPGGTTAWIVIYTGVWLWTMFAGFAGGLLFIPLKSYILQRLRPEVRGAALAVKNAVSFAVCAVATVLVIVLSPESKQVERMPILLHNIASVPFQVLLAGFGCVVFVFTVLAMWKLPNFMLRFVILTLRHTFYRIRVTGAENIPERGPALLLCNHVSAIDSILVSACTSRQIRFLLYEDYFSMPLLGKIAKMTGFFKVPSSPGKVKSMVRVLRDIRTHLAGGGLICVFPEGKLTRNGLVGEFKHGYEKMLPPGVEVPIIPVNISFAWGSVFSNFFSRPGLKRKFKLPFFSAVTFGTPLPVSTPVFEIRQKIVELGAEAAEDILPDELTLHHAAVAAAKKKWWKKCFSDYGGRRYSAFQMVLNAAVISRFIRCHLTSEQQYVGIAIPNSTAMVKALLAVLMADRIPVPLNYSTPQEIFDCSVEKAHIPLVIISRDFVGRIKVDPGSKAVFLEDLAAEASLLRRVVTAIGLLCLPVTEFMNMLSPLSAFDLGRDAVLLFSSGSTGNPKGVRLSHHNLNINARSVATAFAADESDMIVGNMPLFHSFGLNVCFWMPLLHGIPVVYTANPLDARPVCGIIRDEKATMLFATPSFLQAYLRRCRGEDLQSLRLIATGAEKLRDDIADKVKELTGGRLEVIECYGCTELSPVVSINLAADIVDIGKRGGCSDSIGVPLENISVRILDPLDFTPVEPGEEGILCVKGSLVMQGYLGDKQMTDEVMAGKYYKTGDVAKMDENGYLHICGRLSRFSKIAGEMVPHEMVERIINELCACDTRVVAVSSIPDQQKGEALLVLYTPEMPFTPEEIVEQLRERSISNLWIPKAKNFCRVDQLPLLGSGKLDLARLKQIAGDFR